MEKCDLCQWTYKAVQAPLRSKNRNARFRKIEIWILDHEATREGMASLAGFEEEDSEGKERAPAYIQTLAPLLKTLVYPGRVEKTSFG